MAMVRWFLIALLFSGSARADDEAASSPAVDDGTAGGAPETAPPGPLPDLDVAPPHPAETTPSETAPVPTPEEEPLGDGPTTAERIGALTGSVMCTGIGSFCLGFVLGIAPAALIAAGVTLIAIAIREGTRRGGLGGVCCIVLGLLYGIIIIMPGALTLGPLTATGATGGAFAGNLVSRPLLQRLVARTPLFDYFARLRDAVVAGAVLLAALPGLLLGFAATATMIGGAVWASRNDQDLGVDRGSVLGSGWIIALAGALAAPMAIFVAAGGATLAALGAGALVDLVWAPAQAK